MTRSNLPQYRMASTGDLQDQSVLSGDQHLDELLESAAREHRHEQVVACPAAAPNKHRGEIDVGANQSESNDDCQPSLNASSLPIINTEAGHPVLVSIADAESISGLSRSQIYRHLATGAIRAVKDGARTLIVAESLVNRINSLPPAKFRVKGRAYVKS